MDPTNLIGVLKQVFMSWQVLAVTAVFVLYWSLVKFVVNPRKKPPLSVVSPKKPPRKRETTAAAKSVQESSPEVVDDEGPGESRPKRGR
jgi:hypothetical protein